MANDPDKQQTSIPIPDLAKPDLPKPGIPAPDLPKPNPAGPPPPHIPAPSIPAPAAAPPSAPSAGSAPVFIPPPSKPTPTVKKLEEREEEYDGIRGEASFETRAVAYLIDAAVALSPWLVLLILLPSLSRVGLLLGMAYLLVRDSLPFLQGQSIGKKVKRIKAVTEHGACLAGDWKTGVLRNLSAAIFPLPLVEAVLLVTRVEKGKSLRRLGDDFAKTKVVIEGGLESEDEMTLES